MDNFEILRNKIRKTENKAAQTPVVVEKSETLLELEEELDNISNEILSIEQGAENELSGEELESKLDDLSRKEYNLKEKIKNFKEEPDKIKSNNKSIKNMINLEGLKGKIEDKTDDIKDAFKKGAGYVKENLNTENQNIFFNRLLGRIKIQYEQHKIDKQEEKNAKLKNKMDAIDVNVESLASVRENIETIVNNLKDNNTPGGAATLEVKLKVLKLKEAELLNKKDKKQSKFEKRENKIKLFSEKRDAAADKLIRHYEEKTAPMEKNLEVLNERRNEAELEFAVLKATNNDRLIDINTMQENVARIENLDSDIMSNKDKRAATVELKKLIKESYEEIRKGEDECKKKMESINSKIAKVDAKANPYRDKRDKFVRVKNNEPIDMGVETRERETDESTQNRTESHARSEKEEDTTNEAQQNTAINTGPTGPTNPERQTVGELIIGWNKFLENELGSKVGRLLINKEEFLKKLPKVSERNRFSQKDAAKIFEAYYRVNKVPKEDIENYNNLMK